MTATTFEPEIELENPLSMLIEHGPVVIKRNMSREAFHRFLLRNSDFKIERDKFGVIIIYPPMTYDSSINEGEAFFALKLWSKNNPQLGRVLSPSAAFDLPDGSTHKADGSWVSMEKHRQLSEEERKRIAAIVPDFVMEVRSQTDRLRKLKKKMEETWIANGVRLAWLIDPLSEKVWIYRSNGTSEEIKDFNSTLTGEDVIPGFQFDLKEMKHS
jgi:Uma2 family endonuclease